MMYNLLIFIQNICEGHNSKTQNFLREQPNLRTDINLVTEIGEFAKSY